MLFLFCSEIPISLPLISNKLYFKSQKPYWILNIDSETSFKTKNN